MDVSREFRFSPRPNRAAEVKWRPWGEPAFAEARRLGRPVLLSLSAVWCHWCHVMDETSYSDPRVIAAVNEHFVPIRVDNDRHPDVNRRYNMGGWPTTAFLAPSGDVLTGGTYLPPEQMLESLARVKAFFDANKAKIAALEGECATDGDGSARARITGGPLTPELALEALEGDPDVPGDVSAEVAVEVVRGFDPMYGGLGAEPKFPQPDVFGFMLAYGTLRGAGDPDHVPEGGSALLRPTRVQEVVRATLMAMAGGGLYDAVEGGFFRYATQRDWTVPHYEKMLEDNARLVLLYLEASLYAGDHDLGDPDLYRRAAEGTLDCFLIHVIKVDPVEPVIERGIELFQVGELGERIGGLRKSKPLLTRHAGLTGVAELRPQSLQVLLECRHLVGETHVLHRLRHCILEFGSLFGTHRVEHALHRGLASR